MYNIRMSDERKPPERKRINLSNLESAIDKQIRESIERGDFDHLPGEGKPLDLSRDPNVPQDWELAFRLLRDAGFAPDWIETRRQVEFERANLYAPLERFSENPPKDPPERQRRAALLADEFRARATELNRLIDLYNLKAPTAQVHLRRVRIEYDIEQFLQAASKTD